MGMRYGLLYISIAWATNCLSQAVPNFHIYNNAVGSSKPSVVYLFSHGLGATHDQAKLFARIIKDANKRAAFNRYWFMEDPIAVFDFPDAKPQHNKFDRQVANLGQLKDIERLAYAYNETCKLYPSRVSAVIVESPFDKIDNVILNLFKNYYFGWLHKWFRELTAKLAFPAVDLNGVFPIKTIADFPLNVPIIFVQSAKDTLIPLTCSRHLYKALKEAGHEHAYLFELEAGPHGNIIRGPQGQDYQDVIHAWLKLYNLPYNASFAQRGQERLSCCQPTVKQLNDHMNHPQLAKIAFR
jgi:hypothetical protein